MTLLKDRIEHESMRLFVEKGVHATTIRDISKAANVSEGALYRHYKSKEELAKTLFVRNYTEFYAKFAATIDTKVSLKENINRLVALLADAFDNNPIVFQYCLITQHDFINEVIKANTPFSATIALFSFYTREKQCRIEDPIIGCTIFLGIITQAVMFRISNRIQKPLKDDIDCLAQCIYQAVM